MKHMKKLSSLLLALVLALALAVPAFAADPVYFDEPEESNNDYTLYKIFDVTTDGSTQTFTWNSAHFRKGPFITTIQTAVEGEDTMDASIRACFAGLNASSTDKDVAEALDAARQLNEDKAGAMVAKALTTTGVWNTGAKLDIDTPLTPGYYMVVAKPKDGGASGYSLYNIIGNEGEIDINDKTVSKTPEAGKKIQNKAGEWVYAADFAIGEEIKFQLTGTVKGYKGEGDYNVTFHDVMDTKQLKVPAEDQVTAWVERDGTKLADITALDLVAGKLDSCGTGNLPSNCAFHISFNLGGLGIKDGDQIVVEYPSELLTEAEVGTTGNVNDAWLETPSGNTPANPVTAYTFKLQASKVDGSNNNAPLPGAVFTLTKKGETDPITTLGTPVKKDADGKPVKNAAGDGWLYVDQEGNDAAEPMTEFTFPKLSAGEYVLTETQRPLTNEGREYNPAGPFYFKVEPTYDKENSIDKVLSGLTVTAQPEKGGESLGITVNKESTTANMTATVENNTGLIMPETGGIGTTIFYIVGGILAAGAIILLITKRRMRVEEE